MDHIIIGIRYSCYIDLSKNYDIYSQDSSFVIDISVSLNTSIEDLSALIFNFEISDNYFSVDQIRSHSDYKVTLFNNPNFFTFNDISNYYDSNTNKLNVVTYGVNSLAPLEINYFSSDLCNNKFNVTRKVNIIDITDPTIDFSFVIIIVVLNLVINYSRL